MRWPWESPDRSKGEPPNLLQIVDALILFDSPLLDQRFQEAIAMHPDAATRAALAALPPRVAEGSRLTRRGATEWQTVTKEGALDDEFREQAERFLLEGLLDGAEGQIRLKSFIIRHAPTLEVRQFFEDAVDIHRELTTALREALAKLDGKAVGEPLGSEKCCVGPRDAGGDLRSEVEGAVRAMVGGGKKPRLLVLSANALRHLRDLGAFERSRADILGVPVQVDFSWPGTNYALLSFDSVPLEEILGAPTTHTPSTH